MRDYVIVDAFTDEPTPPERVPSSDPRRWAELVAGGHVRLSKLKLRGSQPQFVPIGDAVCRARQYVSKMPPAIAFEGGHNTTFRVACVLVKHFGLSEYDALGILRDYNQRCVPPWSEKELQHKVRDAYRLLRQALALKPAEAQ